jgi:ArsR family transcriptional regulator
MEDSSHVRLPSIYIGRPLRTRVRPTDRGPIKTSDEHIRKARALKVLGDPNRLRIIELLRDGELCQCEILPVIGQSQPTVSRHLRLMEEAGILNSRRDGTRVLYKVASEDVFTLIGLVESIQS